MALPEFQESRRLTFRRCSASMHSQTHRQPRFGDGTCYEAVSSCIEDSMPRLRVALSLLSVLLVLSGLLSAGVSGSFLGKIVEGPDGAVDRNWIYVQGRNGMARRVEISRARVQYDESVPASGRTHNPQDALQVGAEVRITAEQGSDGEWHAARIEILKLSAGSEPKASKQSGG
jgi:hypothetical protein